MAICLSAEDIDRPRRCPRWPGLFLIRLIRPLFRLKPSPYVYALALVDDLLSVLVLVPACSLNLCLSPWFLRLCATHHVVQPIGHWRGSTRLAQPDSWLRF